MKLIKTTMLFNKEDKKVNNKNHYDANLIIPFDDLETMNIDEMFLTAHRFFHTGNAKFTYTSFIMFKKIIEKNPHYLNEEGDNAYFYMGNMCYHDLHDLDAAIEYFTKAVELDPTDIESYLYRGYCWTDKGEFEKAYTDLKLAKKKEAIQYDPDIDLRIQEVEKQILKLSNRG